MFVYLSASSTNHYSEHVVDRSELPHYLIKSAAGDYLMQQTQPKVRLLQFTR